MNFAEMVVIIVVVATIGSVLRARFGVGKDKDGNEIRLAGTDNPETRQLRDEVRVLKERIAVLERLATEDTSGARLDREIEKLRDRS